MNAAFFPIRGLSCLYDKQNNTWLLVDMEFSLLVFNSTSHSFAAFTRELSSETLEEKFHIYAHPCIILYLSYFLYFLFSVCDNYVILHALYKFLIY